MLLHRIWLSFRTAELNLRCSFQAYALRKAFFIDLGARFGSGAMRKFLAHMGTRDSYEQAFGSDLAALEREWLAELMPRYLRIPSATPCVPGEDF